VPSPATTRRPIPAGLPKLLAKRREKRRRKEDLKK
jgi:hypothetical protein